MALEQLEVTAQLGQRVLMKAVEYGEAAVLDGVEDVLRAYALVVLGG